MTTTGVPVVIGNSSARVEEYMRSMTNGIWDERLDALLRPMDAVELLALADRLSPDRRAVSTPGEFTAKAAGVIIGYEITLETVEHILGHTHAAFWVSVAITLGIICAVLRYEERERGRRFQVRFDELKDRQRQIRERVKAPGATQTS
jgi:hypothetical protein